MKRFLNSFVFFVLLTLVSTSLVNASVDNGYFKEVFKEWGLEVDVYEKQIEKKVVDEDNAEGVLESDLITSKPENSNLLVFSSVIDGNLDIDNFSKEYKNIYLVCDSEVTIQNNVCFSNGFVNNNNVTQVNNIGVLVVTIDSQSVYALPINYFVDPITKKYLDDYFNAVKISLKQETQVTNDTKGLFDLVSESLIETAGYAFFILLFVILLYGLFRNMRNPRVILSFFKKEFLKTKKVYEFAKEYRLILLVLFFILLLLFIFMVYVIAIKDIGIFSFAYFSEILKSIVNINKNKSYIFLGLLVYLFATFIVLVLYFFFDFVNIFAISYNKFKDRSITTLTNKWGLATVTFLLIIFAILKIYNFIFIYLVFFGLYLVYLKFFKSNSTIVFSIKEKVILVVALVITVVGLGTFTINNSLKPNYVYTDLFGLKASIIKLPYYKVSQPNEFFNKFDISNDFMVFVDNYLVYSKTHKYINNLPLQDFNVQNDFIIIGNLTNEDFVNKLVENHNLQQFFKKDVGNLIKVNSDIMADNNLSITFDCSSTVTAHTIKYKQVLEGNQNTKPLMYFVGCNEDDKEVIYTTSFDESIAKDTYFVIDSAFITKIKEIKLISDNKEVSLDYFFLPNNSYYENIKGTDTINVFGDLEFVNYTNDNEVVDIGVRITELKTAGKIEDKFKVWSNDPSAIFTFYD